MPCLVIFGKHFTTDLDCTDVLSLKREISQKHGVPVEDLLATLNGRFVSDDYDITASNSVIRLTTKLIGGKGGFGSMLRAIGAQIEKTTNREACRDLSGRRLRDINEEKRLRKWLEGQEEREKEAAERKQKKLERLVAEPKIEVNLNPAYEKERQDLPERVNSAVEAGWQAAGSSNTLKRKSDNDKAKPKKAKLWIDAELSDCSSLSEDEEEEEKSSSPSQQVSTDSGNESDKASTSIKLHLFPLFWGLSRSLWTVMLLLSLLVLAAARPQDFDDDEDHSHEGADDRKDDPARVQIKVYRGPTKHDGYAPWGFWVKQPSDEE
ncbi:hypothetical protein HW555_009933 [Spodoptera exigua]|uniref:SDE2-like domain-containing protein n=2 Tax=Spodoptera exigua TaxID=7107 RepID=A0A835GAC0_SPOEX|nr:hypothetical protein HW555_009933 [Spodoptera exigua]